MYRVLIDYGSEGLSYLKETSDYKTIADFETLEDAVNGAVNGYSDQPWHIIRKVEWKAIEIDVKE